MKAPQFYITVGFSVICLILSVMAISLGQSSQDLQSKLQVQQVEIQRGMANKQNGQKLVNDMAQVSLKNEKIKQVLARNGYTVNAPSPSPSPAASGSTAAPAPVSPAAAAPAVSSSSSTSSTAK